MRNHCSPRSLSSLLIAVLALFLAASSAASAADVIRSQGFSAGTLSSGFFGCYYTVVAVDAFDGSSHDNQAPPSRGGLWAYVEIRQSNTCGSGGNGLYIAQSLQPVDGTLVIDKKLDFATLKLHAPVFDYDSSSTLYVDVDLAWTATGPVIRSDSRSTSRTPDSLEHWKSTYLTRLALASGSVRLNGVEMLPAPTSDSATLRWSQTSSTSVDH